MPPGGRARRILGWGVVAWSFLGPVVIVAVLIKVLGRMVPILPYLVVAGLVVFLLDPAVRRLIAAGLPRRLAATLVFATAAAVTAVLLSLAVPVLVHQAQTLGRSSGGLLRKGGGLFDGLTRSSNPLLRQSGQGIQGWLEHHAGGAPQALNALTHAGLQLARAGLVMALWGFLGFLLLLSLTDTRKGMVALIPPASRDAFGPPLAEIRRIVGGYVRARLIVSAVVGALATLGLWLIHMPFWLILGVVVGVANLIPMLGSWIGAIPVILVSLATKPPSYLLVVVLVVAASHIIDGFILSPIVLKETTNLHPVVVLLAVILGAELMGFWGVLAAIPVAGIVQYFLREWVVPKLRGEAAPSVEPVAEPPG